MLTRQSRAQGASWAEWLPGAAAALTRAELAASVNRELSEPISAAPAGGRGGPMDAQTLRMLEALPHDLAARGWAFMPRESKVVRKQGTAHHIAVYLRPYHSPADHLGTTLIVRGGAVYVSTADEPNTSWEEAHQAAIARMRAIDAPRPPRDGEAP